MSVRWIDAMMMYQWPLLCACWFKVYIINYANSLGFVIRTQYNDDDWLVCAFTALMIKYNVGTYLASRVYVSFIFCFDFVLFFLFRFCFGLCLVLEVLLVCGGLWGRIRLLFTCYYNGNDWCASFFLLEMVELSRDYPAGQPDRTFCNILSFYLQGVIIFGLITVQDCDLTWIHWQHTRTQRWWWTCMCN